MNVGEIIIKTKLAIKEFEEDLQEVVEEAKEKGREAGEKLSQAFNKAVNIGKGLLGVVGKIGIGFARLIGSAGLVSAILGSAGVGALSLAGALKKVFEENEQIKANIQYIVFALTKALEPVINAIANIIVRIINLLFQAVQYTAYLIKAWTGKNIFAGATMEAYAQNMASAEKSSKGIAGNLKDAKKQLAGFDEMNVLSDTSSGGGGGAGAGGGAGVMPDFDLSNLGADIEPPKWMVWIKDNWKIVAFGLGAIAGALLLLKIGLTPIQSLLGGLIIAQIVTVLIGIVTQIGNIIDFIKDPSWENFFKLIEGFFGTQGLLGILVDMAVEKIFGGWDEVEKILKPVAMWIMDNVIQPVIDFFTNAYDTIIKIFEPIVGFFKELFETVFSNAKIIWDNIVQIFSFVWGKIVEIFSPVVEWFADRFRDAYARIKEVFGPIVNYLVEIWNKIKSKLSDIGAKFGETVGGAFKSVVNGTLRFLESFLNAPIRAINTMIGAVSKIVPGLSKLNTFSFPRLAKGGIINQPGRGVFMGSAIGGERGAEGVIPLTDSQQMALLGEAIGRYITVNNVNPIYLNGRQIAREVNISNNESDFAFNR